VLGWCGLCCAARAQESLAVPTQATNKEIANWLQGDDPRMVAWGAVFAAKNHDEATVPYLARLAEGWMPLPPASNSDGSYRKVSEEESARVREMEAVLDALIQLHGEVEPAAIQRLAGDFDGDALTLFARMPEKSRKTFAEQIYAGRLSGAEYTALHIKWVAGSMDADPAVPGFANVYDQYKEGFLLSVAAAILANDPPPGFAASLLNETTVDLELSVGARDPYANLRDGGMCADSFSLHGPPGWPERWIYKIEESWSSQSLRGEILVPGVPTLTTRRTVNTSSCSNLRLFSSNSRLLLLAQMLHRPIKDVGWDLKEDSVISYADETQFAIDTSRVMAQREQAFRTTATELVPMGLMTTEEAQNARPTLQVKVKDMRETKSPPLPEVKLPPGLKKVVVVSAAE